MDEKESFMRELNWRANLWEGKRDDAKRRVELKNHDSGLAEKDLAVAENALKRIEAKKKELWAKEKAKMPKKRVHKKPDAVFALALPHRLIGGKSGNQ